MFVASNHGSLRMNIISSNILDSLAVYSKTGMTQGGQFGASSSGLHFKSKNNNGAAYSVINEHESKGNESSQTQSFTHGLNTNIIVLGKEKQAETSPAIKAESYAKQL
ncbi:hypothetical protein HAX54_013174 [Datura stramonium]|uniref:Uncharacterized protein n=1 Tax=Datura stramonium TaxID=4076 RepID=A0ABS8TKU5_DATST|nr:hypothetical protein [Datura stramonium]